MTRTCERPAPEQLQSPARLEAFGDGMFAIATTLLAFEIAVPAVSGADLLHGRAEHMAGLPGLRPELTPPGWSGSVRAASGRIGLPVAGASSHRLTLWADPPISPRGDQDTVTPA